MNVRRLEMSVSSSARSWTLRRGAAWVALVGLILALASAFLVGAAENPKAKDVDQAGPKDPKPPRPPAVREAGPLGDFDPPGPPRDKDRRRPKPPRAEGQPGGPEGRQPGPPQGPDGPPRRPGPFGPGQQPGPPFRGPQDWNSMEKNDPETFKLLKEENDLDRSTHEMAAKYRQASKDQRDKLKDDLKKLVTQQFEARQKRRTLELNRFEEEIKRLRDGMERREKTRQQIIDKRVSELVGDESEPGF